MQQALLKDFSPSEAVELAQQLIPIPSYLWHESEVGFWIADWLRARDFAVDMTALLDRIAAADPDFRYELIIPLSPQQPNMPAQPATPIETPVVASLIRAHELVSGQRANIGAGHRIGATADTCHFKGVGIQCVEYGPGLIPIWPRVDECIEVEQIVTATKVLALIAAELCT